MGTVNTEFEKIHDPDNNGFNQTSGVTCTQYLSHFMPLNTSLEYLLQNCLYLALAYTYKSNLHKVSEFKLKVDN
jgi:hypothetical protein